VIRLKRAVRAFMREWKGSPSDKIPPQALLDLYIRFANNRRGL
jgi:hypothetical protein